MSVGTVPLDVRLDQKGDSPLLALLLEKGDSPLFFEEKSYLAANPVVGKAGR